MFITKLFMATILAVALSAQTATAPKAPHDDAKSIIKKADRDLGPQIDEALSRYKDGASKFDLLEAALEKSLGCQNSVSEKPAAKMTTTEEIEVIKCRIVIRRALEGFSTNFENTNQAEKKITLRMTGLVTIAASLMGPESGIVHRYAEHLEAATRNNFTERFLALTTKTKKVLSELSQ